MDRNERATGASVRQMKRKGIILAGGTGSRLYPVTKAVNKHMLPVYDKPMIYYPMATLMLSGIRDILIISSPQAAPQFETLLGDGGQLGLSLSYEIQPTPGGVAEALTIGKAHIGRDPVALALGDNILYGNDLPAILQDAGQSEGNIVFAYYLTDPTGMGVVEFDDNGAPMRLVEKPNEFLSNWVIPGLYFFEPSIAELVDGMAPSQRGEKEITTLNAKLLEQGRLSVKKLGRGILWLDCGTPETLLEASEFVRVVEKRIGLQICCLEEIALGQSFIGNEDVARLAKASLNDAHRRYLHQLIGQTGP